MRTRTLLAALALALGLALPAAAQTTAPDYSNGFPTNNGTANEVGTPVVVNDYPWVRANAFCQSVTVSCAGLSIFIEANICPGCPFITMQTITPSIPDANGTITDIYLEPRMYSYRCRLTGTPTGGQQGACGILRMK